MVVRLLLDSKIRVETMIRKFLRVCAPTTPIREILIALAAAVLMLSMWIHGGTLFWWTLPPPSTFDQWAKVLGLTFGIPSGVLALVTYIRAAQEQQRANLWKRREYVAARFDKLDASAHCMAAMRMLDYNATRLQLKGLENEVVNDRLVMSALAPHQKRGTYTTSEQIIRDAFDTFLTEMDRLGAMVSAGLVDAQDLAPYADYWLRLFDPNERARPAAYGAILRRYVRVFHLTALGRLLQERNLMVSFGAAADVQKSADDKLIADFDPSWIAPSTPPNWNERVERVEAAS